MTDATKTKMRPNADFEKHCYGCPAHYIGGASCLRTDVSLRTDMHGHALRTRACRQHDYRGAEEAKLFGGTP